MVFLYHIGTKGLSYTRLASRFRIAEGSVRNYVSRVRQAFIDLQPEVITWPGPQEKVVMKGEFRRRFHFKNCLGTIDGSCIPLFCKPTEDGEDYLDRKSAYSVNLQVYCLLVCLFIR